jgi:hypothetical protein
MAIKKSEKFHIPIFCPLFIYLIKFEVNDVGYCIVCFLTTTEKWREKIIKFMT